MNKLITFATLIVVATISGCSSDISFTNKYGDSDGASGRTSLNGFGALRQTYEQAGFGTRNLYRLTNRAKKSEAVVYIPTGPFPMSLETKHWFESWLKLGDRTLIYVLPDSGSEQQYWKDAVALAPPKLRLEYRRRAARSLNERMLWHNNRRKIPHRGWFVAEPQVVELPVDSLTGEWTTDLKSTSDAPQVLHSEYVIAPTQQTTTQNPNAFVQGPTGPNSPGFVAYVDESGSSVNTELASVASSASGKTLIAKITSRKWTNSKVIVVSGGALVTNYAFTHEFGRKLAERIVMASDSGAPDSSQMASFLTTNTPAIPISEAKTNAPASTGMELLTVWPLSLVTIHAAIFGLVICMIMLPIFGRPKKIAETQTSNFGDHLDAMASLLNRAGGEKYARSRISEYMQRMRGETTGPWIVESPSKDQKPIATNLHDASQTTLSETTQNDKDESDEAQR